MEVSPESSAIQELKSVGRSFSKIFFSRYAYTCFYRCVDDRGFELSKTRTRNTSLSCEDDATVREDTDQSCPELECDVECEHGFQMDEDGCRTCECVDPCSRISCRGEGETCRLVAVECVTWPCPSVPMCLPKKENPCQNGEPLKLSRGEEVVTCGPEAESCPSSHKCQLSPVGEYAVCCPKPSKL